MSQALVQHAERTSARPITLNTSASVPASANRETTATPDPYPTCRTTESCMLSPITHLVTRPLFAAERRVLTATISRSFRKAKLIIEITLPWANDRCLCLTCADLDLSGTP